MSAVRSLAVVLVVAALPGSAAALRLPSAPRCPVFPRSSPWNRRVDRLPVAADSATLIRSIGLGTGLHADFGSGTWNGGAGGVPLGGVTPKTPHPKGAFGYPGQNQRTS